MPNVSDVMSTDPQVVQPQESLRRAAELMLAMDVGALPVCDGGRLVGMLTDRDITVRGVAAGMLPDQACVSDIMSPDLSFCTAEQDTEEVMRVMGEQQVRRLPVIDADKRLVGIVALADLALRQPGHIDKTVRLISEPDGSGGPGMEASGMAGSGSAGSLDAGADSSGAASSGASGSGAATLSGNGAGTSPKDAAPH